MLLTADKTRAGRTLVPDELFDRLTTRIAHDHPDLAPDLPARIMDQALAFLGACAVTAEPIGPTDLVDIGWHTFILHTHDYAEFCDRVAGRFIHHQPEPVPDDNRPSAPEPIGIPISRTVDAITAAGFALDAPLWGGAGCRLQPVPRRLPRQPKDVGRLTSGPGHRLPGTARRRKAHHMPRRHWDELPDGVRRDVERHTGPIRTASTIPTGAASDVAVTLDTAAGPVFCKGGQVDGRYGWLYRNEARVNRSLPLLAPRLLWTVERDGWLLLGFEHAAGRHPDLSPGSPDLTPLAAILGDLARQLTPCPPVAVPSFADRWRTLIAPELVDGDTLLHTDMTPRNFLIETRSATGENPSVRLVDWSGPARGAAWIDTALLLHRLIRAGHDPAAAEEWGRRVPAYAEAPEPAVTAFAEALVVLWERKQRTAPASHHGPLVDAARRWSAHRSCPHGRGSPTAPVA